MVNTTIEQMVGAVNAQVVKDVSQFNVGPAVFERVPVKFRICESVIADYVTALVDEFNNSDATIAASVDITHEGMIRYLNTLLFLRVLTVTNDRRRYEWLNINPYPTVPAYFSLYLENVGVARDESLGIELYPEYDWDGKTIPDNILGPDDYSKFSFCLARFGRSGFEYATRLPRDPKGSWELMSMQMVQATIRNHDGKAHLCYALLASMYAQSITEGVLLPRVSYGQVSRYGGLVKQLAKFKS